MPEKYLFGIFSKNVEIFGVIVSFLLFIIGVGLFFLFKGVGKKIKQIEDIHDDVLIVKQAEEGRRSFSDTLVRLDMTTRLHEKRLDRIDERLDRRYGEEPNFQGEDRRKK